MINIVFIVNDAFIKPLCVLIKSLYKKNKNSLFHFYLVFWENTNLEENSLNELKRSLRCNDKISIIHIPFVSFNVKSSSMSWPDIVFLKILAPYYLPKNVDRFFYIDTDITINKNLESIYFKNSKYAIYGALDCLSSIKEDIFENISDKIYINGGFLLINIEKYINIYSSPNILKERIDSMGIELPYLEQDCINILFSNNKGVINNLMDFPNMNIKHIPKPFLYHFTGSIKPWQKECFSIKTSYIWWKYGKIIYGYKAMVKHYINVIKQRLK